MKNVSDIVAEEPADPESKAAHARAADTPLDRVLFTLDDRRFAKFVRLLDRPPAPTNRLRRLLAP
jgi:uncharacterized protein (DUF1778 family)